MAADFAGGQATTAIPHPAIFPKVSTPTGGRPGSSCQNLGVAVAGVPGNRGPWRVFLSHTGELDRFPVGRTYVQIAIDAVQNAGHYPIDMRHFPNRSWSGAGPSVVVYAASAFLSYQPTAGSCS